jgi:hypothetical protein
MLSSTGTDGGSRCLKPECVGFVIVWGVFYMFLRIPSVVGFFLDANQLYFFHVYYKWYKIWSCNKSFGSVGAGNNYNNSDTFFSLCRAIILLPVFIMLKNSSMYNIPGFSSVCPYSVNVHTVNLEINFDIF